MAKKQSEKQTEKQDNKSSVLKKISQWFTAKPIRWVATLLILVIAAFLIINSINAQNAAQEAYQTIKLERGDLIAIVGATGIVEANQTVELNWETSGRVESVNVKVNANVEPGEILADLADNTLPQSVIFAQSDLVTAKRELEDLVNSDTRSAEAYASLLEAEQDLRDAEDDRDQWNYNDASISRVNDARIKFIQAEEELKQYEAAYGAVKDLASTDQKKIDAKKVMDDAQLARDKALRAINYLLGKAYGQQVAEDFADYDLALAKLDDAQRDWDRVKDGANADDISAAEAKVAAAEATVSLGWLEAPFAGTITQAYPKVGDQVTTGTPGFRIDDLSQLFVDLDISEVDINRVKIGQRADLTFDAISGKSYIGEVTEVASVGKDTGSGVDFTITLKIVDPDEQVRPGMTAAVNIIVSEIKDVLNVPNRAIRLKDGERIIYVLRNGALEEIKVQVGSSSDTNTEILSDEVKEGELIVLNPPFEFTTNGGRPAFTEQ